MAMLGRIFGRLSANVVEKKEGEINVEALVRQVVRVHISRGIDLPCCSTRASNFDFGWSVAPTDSADASADHCDVTFVVVATGEPIGA